MHSHSPVRAGEELPLAVLTEYLRGKIEDAQTGIHVQQFLEGHSNLTYLLVCGNGHRYVLRRGPLGPVAPKAHDMSREYRVLQAVHPHFPEAPRAYLLCEDTSVVGSVFFLMEDRQGPILRTAVPHSFRQFPDHPKRLSEAFIDCQVRLHAIDINQNGLAGLGKPEGFLNRQVHGWIDRWQRARIEDMQEMESVGEWLVRRLPVSPIPSLVHNDYKLDNVVFRSVSEVEAVLDWEMATIGDPLADLGLTLCYWTWADVAGAGHSPLSTLTLQPGWYGREQLIERYAQRTGRDVSGIIYYEVFGIYKLAVIIQQIYFRFRRGQTRDERFQNFDAGVRALARQAANLAEEKG